MRVLVVAPARRSATENLATPGVVPAQKIARRGDSSGKADLT